MIEFRLFVDGVDLKTFPQLIRCKNISNQLRGLLEVEQLQFTCIGTSEATHIDNFDAVITTNGVTGTNIEELVVGPMLSNAIDLCNTDEVKENT